LTVATACLAQEAPKPLDPPGAALRKRIERLLSAGKVEDALKAAGEAVTARGTAGERAEFAALHVDIARRLLKAEDFRRAEELLRKVVATVGDHAEAQGLLAELVRARAATPAMIERAAAFVSVERWGAAARIYRKALALLPDRESQWRPLLLECHREAADQNYRMSNWPEASFHYEQAAAELDAPRQARRAQALVLHAAGLLRFGRIPEAAWGEILSSGVAALTKSPDKTLAAVLSGLGAENAGRFDEAVAAYGVALGGKTGQATPTEAAKLRGEALELVRKGLAKLGPESRPRMWQESLPGEWRVRETERFVIHHHNDRVARKVADALEFFFVEILNDWELPLERFAAWKPKVHVWVYRDQDEFRRATGMEPWVPGFSKKPRAGVGNGPGEREHSMHVFQNHPGLLSSIVPHELTHLMLAYAMNYPSMPLAIDEGLALTSEPDYMRTAYRRVAAERTTAENLPGLAGMLAEPKLDSAGAATLFYARSLLMIEYLRTRTAPTRMLELIARLPAPGTPGGPADKSEPRQSAVPLIAAWLGVASAEELEAGWRAVNGIRKAE
jgi:tetratricopeptide (TPR) repeat protein